MKNFEKAFNEALVDTFNCILKYEESSLKKIARTPITLGEAHLLEAVERLGEDAAVSDIAALARISVPSATIALKKLEGKNYITRVQCTADGRRVLVRLTDQGRKMCRAHAWFHRQMVRNISGGFPDEEKKILLSAVNKLNLFFRERAGE